MAAVSRDDHEIRGLVSQLIFILSCAGWVPAPWAELDAFTHSNPSFSLRIGLGVGVEDVMAAYPNGNTAAETAVRALVDALVSVGIAAVAAIEHSDSPITIAVGPKR